MQQSNNMINYTNCNIDKVSVHQVGNKTNDEELLLSPAVLDISDTRLRELLMKFFLSGFNDPEFYSFTFTNEDFSLNPLFNYSSQIFDSSKSFHRNTVNIAKHLYEVSIHPQIKSGDLFVTYFSDIINNGESLDAIGIFKSENRQPFLKLSKSKGNFSLNYDDGINVEKLDKGCLIFNTERDHGFKVCSIDKSNKTTEAQFWKETFLMLKSANDDYHFTKGFLSIARNYITNQLPQDFEISKADQIDALNRSLHYFKSHDDFDKKEFEKEVFHDAGIIKSFRKFDEYYRDQNTLELEDSFEISRSAVAKQSRSFKSILKLDKNFHIYIHGDTSLIEQGFDSKKGKKYYKIYFDNEG